MGAHKDSKRFICDLNMVGRLGCAEGHVEISQRYTSKYGPDVLVDDGEFVSPDETVILDCEEGAVTYEAAVVYAGHTAGVRNDWAVVRLIEETRTSMRPTLACDVCGFRSEHTVLPSGGRLLCSACADKGSPPAGARLIQRERVETWHVVVAEPRLCSCGHLHYGRALRKDDALPQWHLCEEPTCACLALKRVASATPAHAAHRPDAAPAAHPKETQA